MHDFEDALKLSPLDENSVRGRTTRPYANMVGPYGGIISALLLQAVLDDERSTGEPISLTVNFCGGIADGDFTITRKLERSGKYLQHWSMALIQNESVRTTATLVIGARNEVFSHQIAKPPAASPPDEVEKLNKGMPLPWIDSFDMRFMDGFPNFTGKLNETLEPGTTLLWVGFEEPRPLDFQGLSAFADIFFLRNLNVRGTFPPGGTVTLTTYFHATQDEIKAQGTKMLLGTAACKRLHANFADQQIELWGKNDVLLATGYQLGWYKE